jgi:hypothetical protein
MIIYIDDDPVSTKLHLVIRLAEAAAAAAAARMHLVESYFMPRHIAPDSVQRP